MIGFLAKRHRGKDTAADYLVSDHGYTKRAFAYPLKKGMQEWFGFTDDQLYTDKKEEIDDDEESTSDNDDAQSKKPNGSTKKSSKNIKFSAQELEVKEDNGSEKRPPIFSPRTPKRSILRNKSNQKNIAISFKDDNRKNVLR